MPSRDFSGREVVKALTKFFVVDRTGSHVKLRYEHPTNDEDVRVVSVPMHDRIDTGTLRSIAEQSGARDFDVRGLTGTVDQPFCAAVSRATSSVIGDHPPAGGHLAL